MNLRDTGELLAYISAFDNRNFNEYTAAVWHEIFADYDLAECKTMVLEHFNESTEYLVPAHLTRRLTETRRERLKAIGTVPRVNRADEDRPDAHQLLKRIAKAVASGRLTKDGYENYLDSNQPFEQSVKGISR